MEEINSKLGIKDIAKSDRPRERLMMYGAESLSNAELLAILISSGTKNESALSIAYRILSNEKGDISAFSNYQPEEFCRIKGIGEATACKLSAAIELGNRIFRSPRDKIRLNTPELLYSYLRDMKNLSKEVMRVAMFNSKVELIKIIEVSKGDIASTSASAREIFSDAIRIGAKSIILIHNHPSGDPAPSKEDISITRNLVSAGKLIGIEVMDHLIIGDGSYVSFMEKGLLR